MLYDILPPLLLFISFGGLIALISRVMVRIRAGKVSAEIQAEVDSAVPVHAESVIGPHQGNIFIVRNRLTHMMRIVRTGIVRIVPRIRERLAARRVAKMETAVSTASAVTPEATPEQISPEVETRKIEMPGIGMRDRLSSLAQKGKEGLTSLRKEIATRTPDVQQRVRSMQEQIVSRIPVRTTDPVEQKTAPTIRLVQQEPSPVAPKQGIMSQILKREKEETPLQKAEYALSQNDFDTAEDILVPYLMKHASDTQAYMLLGKTALGKGLWDEAMEIFQQVLKINNEEVDAYAHLGHAALQAGRFTIAMQALQRARDNEPENVRIREELLFIARRMDNKVVEKSVTDELLALHAEVQEPQQEKIQA